MAISPIAIATQGFLNSPLSVAAVRGKLTIADEDIVGGGSSLVLSPNMLLRRIQQEDEELVTIITAFMEVIDE